MNAEDVCGTWKLEQLRITFTDGRDPVFPFGADARGMLVYAPDGHMAAVLSRADRAGLEVSGLERSSQASEGAKGEAFDTYLSYAGRWELNDGEITHFVDLALVPDVVGLAQKRRARMDGPSLVLEYEVVARSGVVRTYTLSWVRP